MKGRVNKIFMQVVSFARATLNIFRYVSIGYRRLAETYHWLYDLSLSRSDHHGFTQVLRLASTSTKAYNKEIATKSMHSCVDS